MGYTGAMSEFEDRVENVQEKQVVPASLMAPQVGMMGAEFMTPLLELPLEQLHREVPFSGRYQDHHTTRKLSRTMAWSLALGALSTLILWLLLK